jgi:Domain of unknown function (DUF4262)
MLSDGARVCRHVADGLAPILHALRKREGAAEDAEWRFWCGARAHEAGDDRLLALEDVVARDPTAVEIVLHPRGTGLGRPNPTGRWRTEAGPLLFPSRPSRRFPAFEPRYPPRPGEPLDAGDLLVLADVAERGWHVAESPEGAAPVLCHTIGLFRSFDHPEVCVLGEPPAGAAEAVDRLAQRVLRGERLDPGMVLAEVIPGRPVTLVGISARQHPELLPLAVWYHGGLRFPAVQAVWPDSAGRFPWERWASRDLREGQPVLAERDPA